MKMALALLCRGNIEEKYRCSFAESLSSLVLSSIDFLDIFSLVTYEYNNRSVLDRQRLSILFQQAIVVRANCIGIFRGDFVGFLDPETIGRSCSIRWIER